MLVCLTEAERHCGDQSKDMIQLDTAAFLRLSSQSCPGSCGKEKYMVIVLLQKRVIVILEQYYQDL